MHRRRRFASEAEAKPDGDCGGVRKFRKVHSASCTPMFSRRVEGKKIESAISTLALQSVKSNIHKKQLNYSRN